jgi:hypothetical protein
LPELVASFGGTQDVATTLPKSQTDSQQLVAKRADVDSEKRQEEEEKAEKEERKKKEEAVVSHQLE